MKTDGLADGRPGARLDRALVERGLLPSRERAQAAIAAGLVLVDGRRASRPSQRVAAEQAIAVLGDPIGYVGRGGQKLAAALDHWQVDVSGRVVLDVGASTGGFTHCLLQRGARLVFAVDVGRDQLDPSLRRDPRVISLEETDIRSLAALPAQPALGAQPPLVDLVTIDVSFISLTLVLPAALPFLQADALLLCLVKPQFELGPGRVGKKGVVRDGRLWRQAVDTVAASARSLDLQVLGSLPSPVAGGSGNREFFLCLRRQAP